MRGKKVMTILVAIAMVVSTMLVLSVVTDFKIVEKASAIPGYDAWGTSTTNHVVGTSYSSLTMNVSTWALVAGQKYYMYAPNYTANNIGCTGFEWSGVEFENDAGVPVYVESITGSENTLALKPMSGTTITFDSAGMYIFDIAGTSHWGNDTSTYAGYLWVNTSKEFTISSSSTSFYYGSTSDVDITVETGDTTGVMIDLIRPNGTTAYHGWNTDRAATFNSTDHFTMVGTYYVRAYRDTDIISKRYYYQDEGGNAYHYDETFGNGSTFPTDGTDPTTSADYYNYTHMGPWDPPELNATQLEIEVRTAEPTLVVTNRTGIYWGFELNMEINVTQQNGSGITGATLALKKAGNDTYYYDGDIADMTWTEVSGEPGNYTISITRHDGVAGHGWETLTNGSWYLYVYKDENNDGTEEWNESQVFTIRGAEAPVRLVVTSDGTAPTNDLKVNIPAYTAADGAGVANIAFKIYGRSVFGERAYYGDEAHEDEKNITVSGDILYPWNGTRATAFDSVNKVWYANVTPILPGGTITISVNWKGSNNGTDSETINIVNGTKVAVTPTMFTYGTHQNVTVTVTDMDDDFVKSATVYLFWRGSGYGSGAGNYINTTTGKNKAGNGLNGEYTFWIKPSEQGDWAPRNITVGVMQAGLGFYGYSKVKIERNHELVVNVTPDTTYAGNLESYDISVLVDGTTVPETYNDITIGFYNETGSLKHEVTSGLNSDGEIDNYDLALAGGTYTVYAYNATHDSQGFNDTVLVNKYTVTATVEGASTSDVVCWLIDQDVNITFEVNSPITNGTLTLQNISASPNGSDTSSAGINYISIQDGVGTITGFNATNVGNVTYEYEPEGGVAKPADGLLVITTATAMPNPATIYIGEPTTVEVTVTHPATGLAIENVRVSLDHGVSLNQSKLAKLPDDEFTDADGKVQFAVTSEASGNITIYIKNETDPNNKHIIKSAARKTMTITADPSVSEEGTFTVTAKDSNGDLITDVTVNILFNGVTYTTTTGTKDLTAPGVPESLDYRIEASAEGYTDASTTIKIIDVPKLYIKPVAELSKGKEFTIYAGADDGNSNGILITIAKDGTTVDTAITVLGEATFTLGDDVEAGTYTITATKDGYLPADPITVEVKAGTPGFELLTLIAAIGVAFILLRRRRK